MSSGGAGILALPRPLRCGSGRRPGAAAGAGLLQPHLRAGLPRAAHPRGHRGLPPLPQRGAGRAEDLRRTPLQVSHTNCPNKITINLFAYGSSAPPRWEENFSFWLFLGKIRFLKVI